MQLAFKVLGYHLSFSLTKTPAFAEAYRKFCTEVQADPIGQMLISQLQMFGGAGLGKDPHNPDPEGTEEEKEAGEKKPAGFMRS